MKWRCELSNLWLGIFHERGLFYELQSKVWLIQHDSDLKKKTPIAFLGKHSCLFFGGINGGSDKFLMTFSSPIAIPMSFLSGLGLKKTSMKMASQKTRRPMRCPAVFQSDASNKTNNMILLLYKLQIHVYKSAPPSRSINWWGANYNNFSAE